MIIITLKKEQMMFEVLLPLQIDLAFGLEMWPEILTPKSTLLLPVLLRGVWSPSSWMGHFLKS